MVENQAQLAIITRAVSDARVRVFRLEASSDTIAARLVRREVGEGLEWHVQRAAEIACSTLGEPVDADRPLPEVVSDVIARTGWLESQATGSS